MMILPSTFKFTHFGDNHTIIYTAEQVSGETYRVMWHNGTAYKEREYSVFVTLDYYRFGEVFWES